MKNLKFICIILTVFLFISCKTETQKDIEKEYLSSVAEKLPIPMQTEWLIVLPGLGCHGCIQEGETFMKDFVREKNTYFVLTKIESLKILQQKAGINVKQHTNVYVDADDSIRIPTDNIVYPCIVHLKDGKYIDHAFQSPENSNAFDNLKMLLDNKN